jgi:hypothetical protein
VGGAHIVDLQSRGGVVSAGVRQVGNFFAGGACKNRNNLLSLTYNAQADPPFEITISPKNSSAPFNQEVIRLIERSFL